MVQPTITNNSSTDTLPIFGNEGATGTNIVEGESFNLDANLFNINIPGTDIDSGININLGLLPKRRTFLISGQFQGTETQLTNFINEIETIAKDSIPPELSYLSTFNKSYTCRINGFTYSRDQATFNILTYTIEFYTDSA